MVKSAPASFLILTKSEFLCQFFVIAPHDPAMLRHSHQSRKFGGCVGVGRVDIQYRVGSRPD
jgi:hypothetical protein